jgi:hypothetical protein
MNGRTVRWALIAIAITVIGSVTLGLVRGWFDPSPPSERTLAKALTHVDRIRVRTGGTCHRDVESERTLFEETDPAKIAEVIRSIRIVDTGWTRSHCMCCGNPSIEFYRGQELVVTLGYHHGRSVRWREGWHGDGRMTPDSAATMNAWLVSHGVKSELAEW